MNQHQGQIGKQVAVNIQARFDAPSGRVQGRIFVSGLADETMVDREFAAKSHFEGNFQAVREAIKYVTEHESQVRGYSVAFFTNAVTHRLLTEDNLHSPELLRIRNEIAELLAGLDAHGISFSFNARPAKKFGTGDEDAMNRDGANVFAKEESQPKKWYNRFVGAKS